MISLENIRFQYKRKKQLFDGLSLQVSAGNIHGLLGLNGAGKTTLLKIVANLRLPTSGRATVFGYKPFDRKPEFLQNLFFLTEETFAPRVSPAEIQQLYSGFYPHFDGVFYRQLLADFEVEANVNTKHMSLGQKK